MEENLDNVGFRHRGVRSRCLLATLRFTLSQALMPAFIEGIKENRVLGTYEILRNLLYWGTKLRAFSTTKALVSSDISQLLAWVRGAARKNECKSGQASLPYIHGHCSLVKWK